MNIDGDANGVTARLVDLARGIRFEEIPRPALEVARHCLLDWTGATLAGSREPLVDILVSESATADASDEATLLGHGERAGVTTAALINGAASHALDFDDTHITMSGHPTAPVLPAALALAEREDFSGSVLLTAMVAGVELECRLGALVNPAHYDAGFHATGTLGTFGAAAAACHLLDVDRDCWLFAMGLAATQAAGLKSGFGTMAKPLHAGRAAANGLLAAKLARGGFTSNPSVIECEQGFAATHCAEALEKSVLDGHAGRFLITDTLFKFHAACYLTHAAIEAVLKIRCEHAPATESIEGIVLEVPRATFKVCNITEPATGLEGKFSFRAVTAMALFGDDTGDPGSFTDARMRDPELIALRDRVTVVPRDDLTMTQTRATLTTKEGGRYKVSADSGIPAADLDRQGARLEAKFFKLASPVVGSAVAVTLRDAVARVEELSSVRDLVSLCVPGVMVEEFG